MMATNNENYPREEPYNDITANEKLIYHVTDDTVNLHLMNGSQDVERKSNFHTRRERTAVWIFRAITIILLAAVIAVSYVIHLQHQDIVKNKASAGNVVITGAVNKNLTELREKQIFDLSQLTISVKERLTEHLKESSYYVGNKLNVYYFESSHLNWTEAEAFCVNWGGHLTSILSKQEEDIIVSGLKRRGITGNDVSIGYNDRREENKFEWTDSSPIGYENWYAGQPKGNSDNDCCVLTGTKRLWYEWSCATARPYVCKK